MKAIDNIIIISDYDSTYELTVWFDGSETDSKCKDIRTIYIVTGDIEQIMDEFGRDVLLCSDGTIEYFEYKGDHQC